MKEIIYLNTNVIHSFIAQTSKGLPTTLVAENFQQDTKTSNDATSKDSQHESQVQMNTGSVQIPLIAASPNGNASYKYLNKSNVSESFQLSQIDAGKEIISKQLHDNALYDFENYLEEEGLLNIVDTSLDDHEQYLGKFIKITSSFKITDIDYIAQITKKDVLSELSKVFYNLEPNGNGKKKRLDQEMGLNALEVFINYISRVLPTGLYLTQNHYISLLKEEYLRESSSELNFKYSSNSDMQVTVLGRATRVFDSFGPNIFSGEFQQFSAAISTLSDMVYNIFDIIKKGDTIVSPIAIYFE